MPPRTTATVVKTETRCSGSWLDGKPKAKKSTEQVLPMEGYLIRQELRICDQEALSQGKTWPRGIWEPPELEFQEGVDPLASGLRFRAGLQSRERKELAKARRGWNLEEASKPPPPPREVRMLMCVMACANRLLIGACDNSKDKTVDF